MIEQLLGLIQENSQQAIVDNPAVPNEHNQNVINTLVSSITDGFQEHLQSGNVSGIMGLLSGSNSKTASSFMENPIVASIAGKAVSSIMQNFGIGNQAAGGIVSSVLPGVLGGLISKVSNPADSSIDFNDILGKLTGSGAAAGQTSGFDFNQIGYAMADGKLDMSDLMRMGSSFMGGTSAGQEPSSSGSGIDLGGMLGGLLGGR